MDGVQLYQGKSNFEEAVYFLPLSSQKFLILISSTSERWKTESTLVPPGGFEHGTPGLEIHRLDQFANELFECGAERVKSRPVLILNLFQIHGPLAYLLKTSDETSGLGKKKMQAICSFIKKEALAQMSSCKFCEISKNTFFTEYLWTTA